ncbi:hypothetical protein PAPYR_5256 [Paratrimastix pyriformis]|uniref:Tyrosine specific protein phosphatases domain-containing protein n=1 Tax=Paratrimastix pyriformis TaxID=342808 RepID=A0ABQ8UIB2_9EUKA|nr:hypothetical protein PAPYR_5256 [Paratrimastix pyriformis]
MKLRRSIFHLFALFAVSVTASKLIDYLVPGRVQLVDSNMFAFLFRGNTPLTHTALCAEEQTFDERALDLVLRQRIAEARHFNFTQSYFLFDLSFVNPSTDCPDLHDLEREKEYVAAHPSTTELWNLILRGDQDDPFTLPVPERMERAKNLSSWQVDNLPANVERVFSLLHRPGPTPTFPLIIYGHCEQGWDRTGQFMGSYAMAHLNMTRASVIEWNESIKGGPIMAKHQRSLDWYCFYLEANSSTRAPVNSTTAYLCTFIFTLCFVSWPTNLQATLDLEPGQQILVPIGGYLAYRLDAAEGTTSYLFDANPRPSSIGVCTTSVDTYQFALPSYNYEYYSYFLTAGTTVSFSWSFSGSMYFGIYRGVLDKDNRVTRYPGPTGTGAFTVPADDLYFFEADSTSTGTNVGTYTLQITRPRYDVPSTAEVLSGSSQGKPASSSSYLLVTPPHDACDPKYCKITVVLYASQVALIIVCVMCGVCGVLVVVWWWLALCFLPSRKEKRAAAAKAAAAAAAASPTPVAAPTPDAAPTPVVAPTPAPIGIGTGMSLGKISVDLV